jgi:hypothetical protein
MACHVDRSAEKRNLNIPVHPGWPPEPRHIDPTTPKPALPLNLTNRSFKEPTAFYPKLQTVQVHQFLTSIALLGATRNTLIPFPRKSPFHPSSFMMRPNTSGTEPPLPTIRCVRIVSRGATALLEKAPAIAPVTSFLITPWVPIFLATILLTTTFFFSGTTWSTGAPSWVVLCSNQ